MDVYSFTTYKDFLHAYIEDHKQKGMVSLIASYCGCDRTYLSQVLNAKADLKPDHVIQLCDNLQMPEQESNYLLLLLLKDRASTIQAMKSFQNKLEKLKQKSSILTNKITATEGPGAISEDSRTLYYSNWMYAAIHVLTSVPALQTIPALASKLNLPDKVVMKVLRELVGMKAVTREKDKYVHAGADVYLAREAPQSTAHHLNWRMKAIERTTVEADVHYTNFFTISKADGDTLRKSIFKLIEEQRKQVRASGTEIGYAFCCDFFAL